MQMVICHEQQTSSADKHKDSICLEYDYDNCSSNLHQKHKHSDMCINCGPG